MSEETILCKCMICLKENENGLLVSKRTYNRHRKNQQEFLEKDNILDAEEISIGHQKQNLKDIQQQEDIYQQKDYQQEGTHQQEDMHQQEDVYQQEDMHQQKDQLDIVDENSDTENFDFNEEDNEYYSDYNNGKHSDEEDDDNDDDVMHVDEDDDEDDAMHVDDVIETNIPIEGLKLLHLKSLYNFTESAYDDIMKIFTTNNISLYKVKKYLKEITGLVPVFYDMCENSCICYTGQYESYQNCPICDSTRLDAKGKAKKVMPYLSIKDRLNIQFNDENRARELIYRHEYITNKEDDDLDEIFDGKIYKELVDENLFNDKRDVAFIASCDGYQIFKQKTDDCWLFLLINNNLDPSLRVKKENLIIPFLIPGPNQPKDFNTFLRPFIDEIKELECK